MVKNVKVSAQGPEPASRRHPRRVARFATAAGLALSVVTALASPGQSPEFPTNPALDRLITEQMAEAGIMGLGAAVIVDRQVVWMKGYGFADRQRARPFTPNTIMNAGSIAKPFLGVAMMRAVHEGKLSLDEDINTYLPFRVVNPHHPNEKITLRHLATHSSGITDRVEVYASTYHYEVQRNADRPWGQRSLAADGDALGSGQGGRRDPLPEHVNERTRSARVLRHL